MHYRSDLGTRATVPGLWRCREREAVGPAQEAPPGKITDVVKKFLATDDEFTSDELNLLK